MLGRFLKAWRSAPPESYTARESARQFSAALGAMRADCTAIFQIGLNAYERAFMGAEISPAGLIRPHCLLPAVRHMFITGEAVAAFRMAPGELVMRHAAGHTIEGESMDETRWRYLVDLAAPTKAESRWMTGAQVFHWRLGASSRTPWQGHSVLDAARSTSAILTICDLAAQRELSIKPSWFVQVPGSVTQGGLDRAKYDYEAAMENGGLLIVNSDQWNTPPGSQTMHLAPAPDAQFMRLRERAGVEILGAMNYPASLAGVGPDGGQGGSRETYRRWTYSAVAPLGRYMAAEISAKLGIEVKIGFEGLMAGDIAGRARGLKLMTESGYDLDTAAKLAALEVGDRA